LNQSLRDRAARDTIGSHRLPQLAGESVNAFCLPPASAKPTARQAVFDLIGRNATSKCKRNTRGFINPNLMTVTKRSGLSLEERFIRVPTDKASPKATGRITVILGPDAGYYQYVVARIDCFN